MSSCSIWIANGPAGSHLSCSVYTDNSNTVGTPLCHNTYTVTGSENNIFFTIPMSGCGTLSANAKYWIGVNSDSSTINIAYDSYPSPVFNCPVTYGTYPPTPPSCTSTGGYAVTNYITVVY
jgi:hypothetical protein